MKKLKDFTVSENGNYVVPGEIVSIDLNQYGNFDVTLITELGNRTVPIRNDRYEKGESITDEKSQKDADDFCLEVFGFTYEELADKSEELVGSTMNIYSKDGIYFYSKELKSLFKKYAKPKKSFTKAKKAPLVGIVNNEELFAVEFEVDGVVYAEKVDKIKTIWKDGKPVSKLEDMEQLYVCYHFMLRLFGTLNPEFKEGQEVTYKFEDWATDNGSGVSVRIEDISGYDEAVEYEDFCDNLDMPKFRGTKKPAVFKANAYIQAKGIEV